MGIGTVASGTATYTTSALATGTHSITAVYEGDPTYANSASAPISQTIEKKRRGQTVSENARVREPRE